MEAVKGEQSKGLDLSQFNNLVNDSEGQFYMEDSEIGGFCAALEKTLAAKQESPSAATAPAAEKDQAAATPSPATTSNAAASSPAPSSAVSNTPATGSLAETRQKIFDELDRNKNKVLSAPELYRYASTSV